MAQRTKVVIVEFNLTTLSYADQCLPVQSGVTLSESYTLPVCRFQSAVGLSDLIFIREPVLVQNLIDLLFQFYHFLFAAERQPSESGQLIYPGI